MDKEFILQLETVPDIYGGEAHSLLEQRTENGAKRRFGKIDIAIKNRLAYELELIYATNTAKLFLHWTDVIAKIKQKTYPYIYSVHNCSLVAFCLGVTEVNPFQTDSCFERLLNRRSTNVPVLFLEVPKGKRAEIWEHLKAEEKVLIDIGENPALSDFPTDEVSAFFEKKNYSDKRLLYRAAVKAGIGEMSGISVPESIEQLADLLAYRRNAEFTNKDPVFLYQENAVGLLVKAGLSFEEGEGLRRAFARKNSSEINFYYNIFRKKAKSAGLSEDKAAAVFSVVERQINFTVCRASYVAMAQYLYMDTYFKERNRRICL